MLTPKLRSFALLGVALALASCAAPKATVVEQAAAPKLEDKVPEPLVQGAVTDLPDDGIRMPDMLGMPGDGDFRSTNPLGQKTSSGAGAVISRPPTDPPSRVKAKAPEQE